MTLPGECDVLVAGAGGAGLAAAVAAAEAGAQVLLLEKMPQVGGTTGIAVGSMTAACTPWQERRHIHDDLEDFFLDMAPNNQEWRARDNLALKRLLARESVQTLIWLRDRGVSFVGPFPETPNRVPRMHNVVPIARIYITALLHRASRAGVRLATSAQVTQMIKTGERVSGAKVAVGGGRSEVVVARHGVILATGDYCNSRELKSRYVSPQAGDIPGANAGATGDGHTMGADVGGQLLNMDMAVAEIRFVAPPTPPLLQRLPDSLALSRFLAFFANHVPVSVIGILARQMLVARMAPSPQLYAAGAILVNRLGERFADERSFTVYDVVRQPDAVAYVVLTEEIARQFSSAPNFISTAPGIAYAYFQDYRRGRPDLIRQGRTPADLAIALGMNPTTLERTIGDVRHDGVDMPERSDLDEGPYYAMGPLTPAYITTEGGLSVDEECRVLDTAGAAIPGLWACGAAGQGGLVLTGHGLHIGWAITSGRISGASAARG
jgi:succinate dehydrogenase/fumarate reductase flavoprotein subunit